MTASESPLKIGIICYPTQGGSGVVAVEIAHALADRGHEIHVISYAVPVRLDTLHRNIRFHHVNVPDYPLFEYPPYSLALAAQLAEVICRHNLDLLHVHYAIPHAVSGWLARNIAGRPDMPLITTLHGTDITIIGNNPSYLPITRFSLEVSDTVTVVSEWLGERVQEVVRCECFTNVVYNFVNSERFKPRATNLVKRLIGGREDVPILMHMSNFRPVKRIQDVVDTYLKVRKKMPAQLVMVGDGPERSRAENQLKHTPYAGEVYFIGPQSTSEEILPAADLFLLPSDAESFGLSALEAQACGVPVIGSHAGGLPEVVTDNETGCLFPVGDVDGMAGACIDLLSDRKRYTAMSEKARHRAVNRFNPGRVLDHYEAIYRDAIERLKGRKAEVRDLNSSSPCDDFVGA